MPTYQYACTSCDHRFEAVQAFSDDALSMCPTCEGRLRKVFSSVGIVFKGSGFYRTDSRAGAVNGASSDSGKNSEPATADSSSSSSSDSGSSSGSSSSSGNSSSGISSAGGSSSGNSSSGKSGAGSSSGSSSSSSPAAASS